ncbi:DDHD-domain-containing protein [Amniculicola lignicola CBS 123094]|uniref:DDHD-domain-containing protein n=1 Tax=Amniculicola lignicola CBS 123094 TaxID=1392246 RepID=A0A6A5WK14_9PLEO|nr:DDHD-domain-containing protein [Amniculicola lignicola CBS 123094]
MSTPDQKPGFLSAGINALSPWGSRSTTPKPPMTPRSAGTAENEEEKSGGKEKEKAKEGGLDPAMVTQRGSDHMVNRKHRLSLKRYPSDCPALVVRWYHAVDVPKRKPFPSTAAPIPSDMPTPRPKKWIAFSNDDSRAIETAFQKVAEHEEAAELRRGMLSPPSPDPNPTDNETSTRVPVNEDYLFDVEIETRELAPTYWMGPVYSVKRGTWFTPDGEPADENLANQLEEGYLKIKPWRFAKQNVQQRSTSQPRGRPISLNMRIDDDYRKVLGQRESNSNPVTPKTSIDSLRAEAERDEEAGRSPRDDTTPPSPDNVPRTYRLFGAHMNSIVTYQDGTTAWILTDDFLSRMGSTLYQRFAGGAHYAGMKYVRGYVDPAKKKSSQATKDGKGKKDNESDRPITPSLAYGSDSGKLSSKGSSDDGSEIEEERPHSPSEERRKTLERHMSSILTSGDADSQEEQIRKRDEQEMREDYKDQSKSEQNREIEHLLLVTHGIGQRLGMRMESVNFIHDVNTLRKSLKAVYSTSPDLQALNSEVEVEPKNSRIQVLPICWRHLLDFPQQSLKHNRKEHDLGDLDSEDQEYPNLDDITVEGVPAVRNLLTDLTLDILLYQSPAYKGHITRIVTQECNRLYRLFKERNPSFKGKVSLVGHSLGSAIMFDLLCQQKGENKRTSQSSKQRRATEEYKLDFEVEDFYAMGSPIGLFQMLKGRRIAARPSASFLPPETPVSPMDDPFTPGMQPSMAAGAFDITTSSPLCKQFFNIFHPTDPVAHRVEPLISPAMSALKSQPLPYTKKGIFGTPAAQGITGIGVRVGQGVTDFWTSVSSGIASGLLNRSLGLTGTDANKMSSDLTHGPRSSRPLSVGPNAPQEKPLDKPAEAFLNEERKRRLGQEPVAPGVEGEHPPTLIDSEIETLFSGFQKRRKSQQSEDGTRDIEKEVEWQELEEKSRKLRKEEAKVRALNGNGRVDYSIQEGAFDISLLASIASHLSYWADEDVAHFMISQLLARQRVYQREKSATE